MLNVIILVYTLVLLCGPAGGLSVLISHCLFRRLSERIEINNHCLWLSVMSDSFEESPIDNQPPAAKRIKRMLPSDHTRVWIEYGHASIPPIPFWVHNSLNLYEVKQDVLKQRGRPNEFKNIEAYDITAYLKGQKLDDDVLISGIDTTISEPLILMNEQFIRHLKSGSITPSGVHKYTDPLEYLVEGVVSHRDFVVLVESKKCVITLNDVPEDMRSTYSRIRNYINCCEPIEMSLLPILTTVIPICLGPKGYMAVPCYVTKEHIKRRGPPYHTDIAVRKMEDKGSSFVRVLHHSSKVVMIIEMKMEVASYFRNVELKDLLELMVYLKYIMEEDDVSEICGALSDTKTWHFLKIKATNGKLKVVKYAQFDVKEEIDLLGLLPAVLTEFDFP